MIMPHKKLWNELHQFISTISFAQINELSLKNITFAAPEFKVMQESLLLEVWKANFF